MRVVGPLGQVRAVSRIEAQLDLPPAVRTLPRIPLRVGGVDPERAQALRHQVPKRSARAGISRLAQGRPLCLFGAVGTLGQHWAFKAAHALYRYARRVGDFIGRLSGADPVLDLLGSQGTLHFNLILREPRELPARHDPQPVVDPEREAATAPRRGEDGVAAILADRDEAQFLHWRPFCAP